MNYTSFLISNFSTGLDKEGQPWLLPVDAQAELFDGYIYNGVWRKRYGYNQYATGQRGGSTYTESRMIHTVSVAMTGAINGVNKVFTAALTTPVSRGSVVVEGDNPVQSFTDDGSGKFYDGITPIGTVDYGTGAVSITLPSAPLGGSNVTVTYDIFQKLPVMGVMNFYSQTGVRELIVADTKYVNRYNSVTNRFDDISPSTLLTGTNTNFFSWTNAPDSSDNQRLLFVNNNDPIQQYNGSTVTPFNVYTESTSVSGAASGVLGDGTAGPYSITTPANTGILPGSLSISEPTTPQTVTDDGFGNLTGDGTGTVNYLNGTISVTFNAAVGIGNAINLTYTQLTTKINTCLHVRYFKDRIILLNVVENGGTRRGLRIRISGTGIYSDIFTTDAIGAGFIDIPNDSFIQACDFNRDTLLIFTETSVWIMRYSGSDVVPFAIERIDESRGSQAPYGTITYLNRTSAESPRGLILSDGYSVVRSDEKIPSYSFNEIDQVKFKLCFAGAVDTTRDHYLIHPSPGMTQSDRILVTNYEEDNFAVYRIPLSCMGEYIGSYTVTWNDLLVYETWDELAADYGDWGAFSYSENAPISIGGGHEGQIFKLNATETIDYPVKIRGITIVDSDTLRVTTDFQNYAVGDIIYLEGITGTAEANDKQAAIKAINTANYIFDLDIQTANFTAYTSGGIASKVIPFQTKTKQFNPFAETNQKVRCGWVYFYVNASDTFLTRNAYIIDAMQSNPCQLTVPSHGFTTGDNIYIDNVGGMTELNQNFYTVTVEDADTIYLDDTDATGYTAYTSGGFTSIEEPAKLQIKIISNDREQSTQVTGYSPTAYEVNLTSEQASQGVKKWYKLYVNQVARFIQFEISNNQAGCKVELQAIMPGFAGVGRMI